MPRVKGGSVARKRRKKILKLAKGYYGSKHTLYKTAHEQVMHSLAYAYRDRKQRKRNFRKLWITRINAATRMNDMSYSKFMHGLKVANIEIDRKVLADLAIHNAKEFSSLVEKAKEALTAASSKKTATTTKKSSTTNAKVETASKATDLNSLSVVELKELAKDRGIKGYSKLKKAELIDLLA